MIKSIFASLITTIFSFVFFASFLLFVLLNTILDTEFYRGDLSENLYETTIEVAGGALHRGNEQMQEFFTEGELKNTFREVINAEDFEAVLVPFITQIIDPVFDEDGVAVVTLDLTGVLDKLPGFTNVLAGKLYDTLPVCEGGEGSEGFGTECIPPEFSVEDFKKMTSVLLDREFLSSIPNKLATFEFYEQDLEIFGDTKLSKDLLWTVWWMSVGVLAFLLIIIALIILKPWHRVVRWVSKPLLTGSIFTGVSFLVVSKLPDLVMKGMKSGSVTQFSEAEMESVTWFLKEFLWLIASKALMYSAIVFVVGLILYITGVWGRHHSHD